MIDHAHELRRYARKIIYPQGETLGVMLRAADEIERLQSVIAGLRAEVCEERTAELADRAAAIRARGDA